MLENVVIMREIFQSDIKSKTKRSEIELQCS